MIRYCDGKDVNLIRQIKSGAYEPCDCGLSFDDVDHTVVFPHTPFAKTSERIRAAIDALPPGEAKDALTRHLIAYEDAQSFRSSIPERVR